MTNEQFDEMMATLFEIQENTANTAKHCKNIQSDNPLMTAHDLDDVYERLGDIEKAIKKWGS